MRLLMCMESWKARGLIVFVMLLFALMFVACDGDKDDFNFYGREMIMPGPIDSFQIKNPNLNESLIPKSKRVSSYRVKRPSRRIIYKSPRRNFLVPKNDISDTVNYSPEQKAKNYQKSFKIWSGIHLIKQSGIHLIKQKRLDSDSSVLDLDTSSIKLDKNYEIPFVGKTLKIGDKEYSIFEIVELVQKEKTDLLNVIASNIVWNGLFFRLNLNDLRKGIDSLQTIKKLFSEIDLKVRRNSKSFSSGLERKYLSLNLLNLDTLDRFIDFSQFDKLLMEYCPRIKNKKVKLGNLRMETEVDASIITRNTLYYENGKILISSDVKLVVLCFPGITFEKTRKMKNGVKWDFLNIFITDRGINDNVSLTENSNNFYIFDLYLKRLIVTRTKTGELIKCIFPAKEPPYCRTD